MEHSANTKNTSRKHESDDSNDFEADGVFLLLTQITATMIKEESIALANECSIQRTSISGNYNSV